MAARMNNPTPYPDVNTLLNELLASAQDILVEHLVGMYLSGSLACGDFLIVTDDELSTDQFSALREVHARIAVNGAPWSTELEGAYIPLRALRRYDPVNSRHPHIERGGDRRELRGEQLDWA